jgi:nitroreductase
MSASYEGEWLARCGDETGVPRDVPEVPWLRQVLLRRTHGRYADRPVAEPLLRRLLAAAFSVSSKSDFQQASVIRVDERARRDRRAALVPDMPQIGNAPVFGLLW